MEGINREHGREYGQPMIPGVNRPGQFFLARLVLFLERGETADALSPRQLHLLKWAIYSTFGDCLACPDVADQARRLVRARRVDPPAGSGVHQQAA